MRSDCPRDVGPSGLSPAEESFLRQNGVDPKSPEVAIAKADGGVRTTEHADPVEFSLESIIQQGRRNGARFFVHTRAFIKRFKMDPEGTSIPTKDYDPLCMNPDERAFVAKKIVRDLFK